MQEPTVYELAERITDLVRDAHTVRGEGNLHASDMLMSEAADEYRQTPSVLRELARRSDWTALNAALMELEAHARATGALAPVRQRVLRRAA